MKKVYTKEQLSKMSDHEINLAVAEKINLNFYVRDYQDIEIVIQGKEEHLDYCIFDPCKNWNDVMPVAKKYKIDVYTSSSGAFTEYLYIEHQNNRRAICEVILMVLS